MASIVTQSDQNGPKWVQNGPKWVPKGVKKGSKGGVPKWVPQRSEPKKSRKILFIWPQSTKKVTHVPVFEDKKLFLRKNIEKKNRPTGGVVPQGGLQGGVGREKKSSRKNLESESPPKKKCPKKIEKKNF